MTTMLKPFSSFVTRGAKDADPATASLVEGIALPRCANDLQQGRPAGTRRGSARGVRGGLRGGHPSPAQCPATVRAVVITIANDLFPDTKKL
jgi:hypothetical protein